MPVINGVYLKDFTALPGSVADANIIPIAITGDNIAYRTTVSGIVTDARITSKLLTGLSVTGGAVVAADTILQAFGKVQNQINGKQGTITLTTTGTSGAATFVSNTLNIPNYGSALTGYVPYTGATQDVNLGAFNLKATNLTAKSTTTDVHIDADRPNTSTTAQSIYSTNGISQWFVGLTGLLDNNYNIFNPSIGAPSALSFNKITNNATFGASVSSTPQGTLYGTASASITSAQLATSLTDETGTSLLVFNTNPTIVSPVTNNIAPSSNFTVTQNSVTPINSIASGAIANTLYLSAGSVGVNTSTPNKQGFNKCLTINCDVGTNVGFELSRGDVSTFDIFHNGSDALFTTRTGTGLVFRTNSTAGITLSSAQAVRFHAYGAGTLTTDANGNITATSDETWKEDFKPFTRGLADLKSLQPVKYHWNEKSGLDRDNEYVYFKAQDVHKVIPEAVFPAKEGQPLGVQDRPIIATMINAINELNAKIELLEARIKVLETKP